MRDLARRYTLVIVTHNMQQAARSSGMAAFMLAGDDRAGRVSEYGPTEAVLTAPGDRRTEDDITCRFG